MSTPADSLALFDALVEARDRFEAARAVARASREHWQAPAPLSSVLLCSSASAAPARDATRCVLEASSRVPLVVLDGARLPPFVGPGTLVMALTAGRPGAADEVGTEALAEHAVARGASVVCIGRGPSLAMGSETSGSKQGASGPESLVPLLELVPGAFEAAIAFDLAPDLDVALDEAAEALGIVAADLLEDDRGARARSGSAAHLASAIGRTIPLFAGSPGPSSAAAGAMKRAWNLLAKAPAWATERVLLEDVTGLGQSGDVTRQLLTLVLVGAHEPTADEDRQLEELIDIAEEALARVVRVRATSKGRLARLLEVELVGLGAAALRAAAEGIDPGPLAAVDELRRRAGPGLARR